MKTLDDLGKEIEVGELRTEARAILDYSCMSVPVCEWIVSHEILRRQLGETIRQRDGLQKQVNAHLTENSRLMSELDIARRQLVNIQKRQSSQQEVGAST